MRAASITHHPPSLLSSTANTSPTGSSHPYLPTPPHMHNPHWWRYRDKSCCHPRNVCHCLWYRDTRWNGYREKYCRKWYDCRNTGPLRCLLIVLAWLLGVPWTLLGALLALCVVMVALPFIFCGMCCIVTIFMCLLCFCSKDKRPS